MNQPSVFLTALSMATALALLNPSKLNADGLSIVDHYLTVGEVEVEEIKPLAPNLSIEIPPPSPPASDDTGSKDGGADESAAPQPFNPLIDLDTVINLGKKIWVIIDANKPVVDVHTDTANALPKGAQSWQDLANWQAPVSKLFHVTYRNLFRMKVVDFSYRVLYTYGGTANGKGQYLTNVTIVPAELNVAWGYYFSAQALVPNVTNAGSSEDPIAAAELMLRYTVKTTLKHSEVTSSFYVRGDGNFKDLSNGSN